VLFFASAREAAGGLSEMSLEVPAGTTARQLLALLAEHHHDGLRPLLADLACAVNEKYVAGSTPLRDRDVVAVMPPISGG
jgi:molybdopterin converting factor subunit 1